MDIARISTTLSSINTQSQIGVKLLDKALETNDILGNGLVDMMNKSVMEQSVNPDIGSNFDMYI
ncbi:MAG: YjfB family protein [Lachnospiraceae bacterium]|nr:YjfB family protein [Lachnospiraceae bacterium]